MKNMYKIIFSSGKTLRIYTEKETIETEANKYMKLYEKYYEINHAISSIQIET